MSGSDVDPPRFLTDAFSVNENGTPIAAVTVQRIGGSAGAVSATITFTGGTATGGSPPLAPPADYDNTPIVVSFAAGDTADKVINVPILDDNLVEGNEAVDLALGSATGGATIGTPSTAVLTIVDDDSHGSLQFSAPSYSYDENGTAIAAVTVQRVGGIDGAVSVTVTSTDGTANSDPNSMVEPVDYTPLNTVVSFADQDGADKVVPVAIVQDLLPELDETFTVSLSQATGGVLIGLPSTATVTIIDDDTLLTIPNPTPQPGAHFGFSVAKVGRRLAIGAPNNSGIAGAVPLIDPAFGTTVTTFGNVIVVGAPDDDAAGVNAGAVYRFDNTTGVLLQTIPPPVVLASGRFGSNIAAVRNRICVQQEHGGPLGSGRIFVLNDQGALVQTIDDPTPSASADFGNAMCDFDGALVVGSPGQDVSSVVDVGSAFIFKVN